MCGVIEDFCALPTDFDEKMGPSAQERVTKEAHADDGYGRACHAPFQLNHGNHDIIDTLNAEEERAILSRNRSLSHLRAWGATKGVAV